MLPAVIREGLEQTKGWWVVLQVHILPVHAPQWKSPGNTDICKRGKHKNIQPDQRSHFNSCAVFWHHRKAELLLPEVTVIVPYPVWLELCPIKTKS